MKNITQISALFTKVLALLTIILFQSNLANAIEKRALIIGIGNYGPDSEWLETHGDKDAKIMADEIKTIGFNTYTKIANNEATKTNIIDHLNQLYDSCKNGDIVLFYFSGHGQLILDYNGDEQDGYDESLVLYNAPKSYDAVYQNESHLLDDELSQIIDRFRIKLGSEGEFIVITDVGFGWSNSAGHHMYERGGNLPLEQEKESHDFKKIGLFETGIIDDLPFSIPSTGHANLFSVTANHISGTARELNGTGILTLAVTRSLEDLNDSTDYASWFKKIRTFASAMGSSQTPLAEGDGSTIVFDLYNKVEGTDYKADYAVEETTRTMSDEEVTILSDLKDRLIEEHNNEAENPDFGVN